MTLSPCHTGETPGNWGFAGGTVSCSTSTNLDATDAVPPSGQGGHNTGPATWPGMTELHPPASRFRLEARSTGSLTRTEPELPPGDAPKAHNPGWAGWIAKAVKSPPPSEMLCRNPGCLANALYSACGIDDRPGYYR